MDRGVALISMVMYTRENGKITKEMDKEATLGKTEVSIVEAGRKTKGKVLVKWLRDLVPKVTVIKISISAMRPLIRSILENGKMT
jgi:hypothetical protein